MIYDTGRGNGGLTECSSYEPQVRFNINRASRDVAPEPHHLNPPLEGEAKFGRIVTKFVGAASGPQTAQRCVALFEWHETC